MSSNDEIKLQNARKRIGVFNLVLMVLMLVFLLWADSTMLNYLMSTGLSSSQGTMGTFYALIILPLGVGFSIALLLRIFKNRINEPAWKIVPWRVAMVITCAVVFVYVVLASFTGFNL